ncbi:hypothetical protein [Rheinheimera sp.]|uniref:hypothetical protein n=1 Tax=Rheinheimera sp. TaxID=1869214 RepID=UPI003AF877DC
MQILSSSQQQQASGASVSYAVRRVSPSQNDQSTVTKDNSSDRSLPATALPTAQSKSEEDLAEISKDAQLAFNKQNTVGTIKRLLELLNNGELKGWIDLEKLAKAYAGTPAQSNQSAEAAEAAPAQLVQEWRYSAEHLAAELNGSASFSDGTEVSWSISFEMSYQEFSYSERVEQPMQDPLVLSMNGQPAELTDQTSAFALTAQQSSIRHLAYDQYYLAADHNDNGQVDNGTELFGPQSGQGFAELAQHDDDLNGWIDQNDRIWSALNLWRPGDGLYSMKHAGVMALNLNTVATPFTLRQGDQVMGQLQRSAVFLTEEKQAGLLQQIDISV